MCTKICCCRCKTSSSTSDEEQEQNNTKDERTEPLLNKSKQYDAVTVNDLLFDAENLDDIETASCSSGLSKEDQILFSDVMVESNDNDDDDDNDNDDRIIDL